MSSNTLTFEGFKSGDYEAFCFDVDKDTAKSILDPQLIRAFGLPKSYRDKKLFRIYPNDILEHLTKDTNIDLTKKIKVTITIEQA
jgi:hypothetical protein